VATSLRDWLCLRNGIELLKRLRRDLGVRAEAGTTFAELTSLRVGAPIDWVIAPETEEKAAGVVHELSRREWLAPPRFRQQRSG